MHRKATCGTGAVRIIGVVRLPTVVHSSDANSARLLG